MRLFYVQDERYQANAGAYLLLPNFSHQMLKMKSAMTGCIKPL